MTQRQFWGWAEVNLKLSPADRLNRAICAYEEKYEARPTFAFVHPTTLTQLEGQQGVLGGCALYGNPGVPRNNYYFGMPGDVL